MSESPENPSSVLHVHYAMPVLSDRDVVIYESTQKGLPDDPTAADSWTSFAMSIQHPHCPKRRGVVRGAHASILRLRHSPSPLMRRSSHPDDHGDALLAHGRRWRSCAFVPACRPAGQHSGGRREHGCDARQGAAEGDAAAHDQVGR